MPLPRWNQWAPSTVLPSPDELEQRHAQSEASRLAFDTVRLTPGADLDTDDLEPVPPPPLNARQAATKASVDRLCALMRR